MRCNAMGICLLLMFWPMAGAADDKPQKKDLPPAQEVRKLIEDYQLDQQAFSKLIREARNDAERQKITEQKMPKPEPVMDRLLELAEANPKDKGVVPGALIWIAKMNVGGSNYDARKDKALDQLLNHAHNPQVAELCPTLSGRPSVSGEYLLRALAEKGPTPVIKGHATYSLAKYLKNTAEKVRALNDEPTLAGIYPKEVAAHLQKSDPDAMANEAEKLFAAAARKYADVQLPGNHLVGEMAETELFELRNLAIGKTAPQIEGVDLDGKKFKLTEYRGKVVVLAFWGNWCSPCREMYEQERTLVKRHADKPFALVGINSDTKAAELRRAMEKEQITWRSWWNGPEGVNGPLSKKWNVHAWPTIYVLDSKGVIRFKSIRGEKLDKAVDQLLKEVE